MRTCPKCHSERIHRSRARNTLETWRKRVTGSRPYRCHLCGWRGWALDSPDFIEHSDTPSDPLGRAKALTPDELDRLDPTPAKARK
jgi:predicted RNA-binding Zn-ribbon protein involved in translation (DUF1610 family)